jgi:4-hydroxybenzoate polyprenyltransferase
MTLPNPLTSFLQLIRAPAVFSAASNILAAQLIVTGGRPLWSDTLLLVAISTCLYAGGMVLNDCFDIEQDRRQRPFRPLPSGRISLTLAWMLVVVLFAGALTLSAQMGQRQFMIAAILIGCIVIYDGLAKDRLVGSLIMGACRYLNWVLGLSTTALGLNILLTPLPVFFYVAALTTLSLYETGDKERVSLAWVMIGLLLTVAMFPLLILAGVLANMWVLPLMAIAVLPLVVRFSTLYRNREPQEVQRTVTMMIYGIIPLDALMVFAGGPWWGGLALLWLLVPAKLMGRYLYVS